MVLFFALGVVLAMYLTGGIGDGVGIFESDEEPATSGAPVVGASESATPDDLFDDDDGSDAERAIELAVEAGAMAGCGEEGARTFCPQQPITRAEFAVALDAVLDLAPAESVDFEDVPVDAAYAGAVARIAEAGVTRGCDDTRFCPDETVTRAQAAALVSRTIELPPDAVQSFADVPADSTFAEVIGRMAAQGIMDTCAEGPPRFCPDEPLTRAVTASLLVEAGLVG